MLEQPTTYVWIISVTWTETYGEHCDAHAETYSDTFKATGDVSRSEKFEEIWQRIRRQHRLSKDVAVTYFSIELDEVTR